jgi:hypothetical protein
MELADAELEWLARNCNKRLEHDRAIGPAAGPND